MVVQAAARHGLQSLDQHLPGARRVRGAGVQGGEREQEGEGVRLRELGLAAHAAVDRVEGPDDGSGQLVRDVCQGGVVWLVRLVAGLLQRGRLDLLQAGLVGVEELAHALQGLQQLIGRHVGGAGDDVAAAA